MEKMEIRKLSPVGLGKLFAIIGLVTGIMTAVMIFYMFSAQLTLYQAQFSDPATRAALLEQMQASGMEVNIDEQLGQLEMIRNITAIVTPLAMVVAGFVLGLLCAWLFNFMAKYWGGIKVDVKEIEHKK